LKIYIYIAELLFSKFLIILPPHHLLATSGNTPEKNATLVVKLHKCHIFEKAPSSISDVTKETLHEEELAKRAEGNEKFELKNLEVDGFDAQLYFDVKDMENITLGDIINLVDRVQADDKKIEVSFRFQE